MQTHAVRIPAGGVQLDGDLTLPPRARGVVLFAHGSGSSRKSPRNRFVAQQLQAGDFATLLLDLLTRQEEQIDELTGNLRFDIGLLAQRLQAAAQWLRQRQDTQELALGYFGASTGGGAALVAAAADPGAVSAVVSRGGRPDLAGEALSAVRAPTLLIVGGDDEVVIEMNRSALAHLRCTSELKIIPGATHLFEEPGKLEEVARLARQWFTRYLQTSDKAAHAGV